MSLHTSTIDLSFWKNKNVFLTGNTGFKGAWLSLWLLKMGANLTGFSLSVPTSPSLFEDCNLEQEYPTIWGNVQNLSEVKSALHQAKPSIVIHMAAQPLVRYSYDHPVETFATNVMGTVNVLESARSCPTVKAILVITTDKCYENQEWPWGYRETDALGGFDPYSNSKGCAEMVAASYRQSYFPTSSYHVHQVGLATARAGNVIGGGDWALDRLIPDIMRAVMTNNPVLIRSPYAIRPWQHVLEPLGAYLLLAQNLYNQGDQYSRAWNIGPHYQDAKPVSYITEKICKYWGEDASFVLDSKPSPHEASFLKLDISLIQQELLWKPTWNLDETLKQTVDWFKAYQQKENIKNFSLSQLELFCQK